MYQFELKISDLQEFQKTLLFRLEIDQIAQSSCENNATFANSTTLGHISKQHIALQPLPVIYDFYGIILILSFVSVIAFENYYLHDINNQMEHDEVFTQILHRVNDFVLRKHPITFVFISLIILMTVPWAWLGFLDRSVYVKVTFKAVVAFSSASLLFFVGHNARRLFSYLPRDKDEWLLKLRDWTWWLWLASRVLGVYDLATGTNTLLWCGGVIWFSWPFRYFYYYRLSACCGGAACADSQGVVDVFLVNMLGHSALLVAVCFALYLLILVPPLPVSGKDIPVGHDNVFMRLWTRAHRLVDRHTSLVALLSVSSLVNSLLALVRVLWFVALSSPCGLYAACVAWMFIHAHIALSLFAVPVVNALIERQAVVSGYRASFIDKFSEQQHQQRGSGDDKEKAESSLPSAAEESAAVRDAAADLFDNVLALSMLYYVFVHPHVKEATAASTASEGLSSDKDGTREKEEEVRLGGVFQAMLQTELYAFAHQEQAQQEEEEGGNNADERDLNCADLQQQPATAPEPASNSHDIDTEDLSTSTAPSDPQPQHNRRAAATAQATCASDRDGFRGENAHVHTEAEMLF